MVTVDTADVAREARQQQLTTGTLVAAAVAVALAQVGLSLPAVLNGLFNTTWSSARRS